MKKFEVNCSIVYTGHIIVEAENESEAEEMVRVNPFNFIGKEGGIPCTFGSGDVSFDFGELTTFDVDEM